jgi:SdpC family antimicrobial peptide
MRITPRGRFRLAMFLVLTLLVVHPNLAAAASAGAQPAAHSTAARFDGETLYRGLAFAQGPVAALFPELASLPPASAEAIAVVDRIVARIRSIEPSFFAHFASAIQKGDRVRIRAALENARTVTEQAVQQEFGTSSQAKPSGPDCIFISVVLVVTGAAVVALLMVVSAVTVVNFQVTGNVMVNIDYIIAGSPSTSTLTNDLYIDSIARTLKA